MKLFTPSKIGPVELRNRTIRSAAFEGMGRSFHRALPLWRPDRLRLTFSTHLTVIF